MAMTGPGCYKSDDEKALGEDDLEAGVDGVKKWGGGEGALRPRSLTTNFPRQLC